MLLLCCYYVVIMYHVMLSCGSVSLVKIYCWMYFRSFFMLKNTFGFFGHTKPLFAFKLYGKRSNDDNTQITEYRSLQKTINHKNVEFIKFLNIEYLPLLGIFYYYFGLTFLHTFV